MKKLNKNKSLLYLEKRQMVIIDIDQINKKIFLNNLIFLL